MIFDKVSIKPFRNRKDRCGGVAVLLGTAKKTPLPKAVFRRKILDQAKFLSKGRVAGCGTASHGFNQFLKSKSFCPFSVLCLYKQHTVFSAGIIDIYKTLYAFFFCKSIKIFPRVGMQIFMRVYNFP